MFHKVRIQQKTCFQFLTRRFVWGICNKFSHVFSFLTSREKCMVVTVSTLLQATTMLTRPWRSLWYSWRSTTSRWHRTRTSGSGSRLFFVAHVGNAHGLLCCAMSLSVFSRAVSVCLKQHFLPLPLSVQSLQWTLLRRNARVLKSYHLTDAE